jgi:hypothetical protein
MIKKHCFSHPWPLKCSSVRAVGVPMLHFRIAKSKILVLQSISTMNYNNFKRSFPENQEHQEMCPLIKQS